MLQATLLSNSRCRRNEGAKPAPHALRLPAICHELHTLRPVGAAWCVAPFQHSAQPERLQRCFTTLPGKVGIYPAPYPRQFCEENLPGSWNSCSFFGGDDRRRTVFRALDFHGRSYRRGDAARSVDRRNCRGCCRKDRFALPNRATTAAPLALISMPTGRIWRATARWRAATSIISRFQGASSS